LINQFDFLTVIQYIRIHASGIEEPPPPVRMEELKRQVACPKCGQKMDTHPYGGPGNIIIDNCPACMLNWLDYMELYRVTHSPDGKKKDPADSYDDRNLSEYQKKYFRPK
jgi:Zn-finger nucleic acid-binding protein